MIPRKPKSFANGTGKLKDLEKVSIHGYIHASGKSGYRITFRKPIVTSQGETKTKPAKLVIQHQTYETWNLAISKATAINSQLLLGTYNDDEWFPKLAPATVTINLKDVWHHYIDIKKDTAPQSTKNNAWKQINKLINVSACLDITESNLNNLVTKWINIYSYGTLERTLTELNTALHLYPEYKNINIKEYLKQYKHLKQSKNRSSKVFNDDEIKHILDTFKDSEYYYRFILMMCLTGARPGELLQLKQKDVSANYHIANPFDDGTGVIKIYASKTKRERYFPINKQLDALLKECWDSCNKAGSVYILHNKNGNKIDLHNFTNRQWKPKVRELVETELIKEYLPLYNLRHTWITKMLNTPMDDVTIEQKIKNIAYLAGTSQKMIFEHYQGLSQNLSIPTIEF